MNTFWKQLFIISTEIYKSAMFWLYVDTAALYDLQALIQVGVVG